MRRWLRNTWGRRERVVPVVTWLTRRRWRRAPRHDWGSRLHLRYVQHRDAYQPAYFAKFGSYRMPRRGPYRLCRWYVADVAVPAWRLVRHQGPLIRHATGVSLRRQLREMLWLSITVPAKPETYYKYEWYLPANRARAGEYLHRHETKGGLYAMLGPDGDLEKAAPLNDKAAFTDHAVAAGLPVVPTLALVGGEDADLDQPVPAADVFIKPREGKGGRQVQKWRYAANSDRFHRQDADEQVSRVSLLRRLHERTAGRQLLVQPCLSNHADLAGLALDAVATCRLITIINEGGDPEPVIAIMRMPADRGAIVDNLHRGGLASPVDIDAGLLGAATGYVAAGQSIRYHHHPTSGELIDGRTLPFWQETRELAVRAHAAFAPRLLVGWDICIGPDGPVLVEGNEQPGVDGLQRLHQVPLGSHRFGQLLDFHLDHRFGDPTTVKRRRSR